MFGILSQALLIGYSGAIMPGPLLTYTINHSIHKGFKAGLFVSIGHSLLELMLVTALFLGLGNFIALPAVEIIIGTLGGSVILFFGFGMVKDALTNKSGIQIPENETGKKGSMIWSGALISAVNPFFLIWWASIGLSLMMVAYHSFGVTGIALFYFGHILADFSWFIFISALVGKSRRFINDKVYKIVKIVLALCLIGFGINFIVQAIIRIFAL